MTGHIGGVDDRDMQRLRSLVVSLTKTNRITTGDRKVTVKLADRWLCNELGLSQEAPGQTRYPNIYISYDKFDSFKTKKTLVQLLGLNYHELGHVMFTSRDYKPPLVARKAWNCLEDQRMESLFTARYGPSGKYFTAMVVKMIVEDEDTWQSAFAWTHGRSYLPLEIRQEFEARFALPHLVPRIKELIEQYKKFRAFHFRSKTALVNEVVIEFQQILDQLRQEVGSSAEPDACGNPEPSKEPKKGEDRAEGDEVNEDAEREAQKKERRRTEKEEETGEDQSGFWEEDDDEDEEEQEGEGSSESDSEESDSEDSDDEDSSSGDAGDDSDDSDGESSNGGDSDADSEDNDESESTESGDGDSDSDNSDGGDAESEEGNGGDETEGEVDEGEGAPGVGSGGDTFESQFEDEELAEYLDEIDDAINEDEGVVNEVNGIQEAMNDLSSIDVIDFGDESYIERTPSALAQQTVSAIGLELQRLYAEVEPGWKYGSDVGKLNVDRAMHDPSNYEEMFDEWDEGRENEVGLEVVLCCDLSGSMDWRSGTTAQNQHKFATPIEEASEALWIIKRALDEVDAKVTVLGFHENTVGLYSRDQKAPRAYWQLWNNLGPSTEPVQSMVMARRIFSQSTMPNKLFVLLTDGQLGAQDIETGGYADLRLLVDSIPANAKIYVGIGGSAANQSVEEQFDVRTHLKSPTGLVLLTRNAVMKMLNARRH